MTESLWSGHQSMMVPDGALPPARQTEPSIQPTALALPPDPARDAQVRTVAFRTMYEAHVDFVWRNLRRLGVPSAEADDKTQEVFVIAHRRFSEFVDFGHGPRAWLFQIVLRVASDARRHRRRHPEDPDGGHSLSHEAVDADQAEAIARREALDRLDRALATIEVGRRAVLVLHEIEEMTAPEVAQILSLPLNTVYSRLRVARGELEAALARQDREDAALTPRTRRSSAETSARATSQGGTR